MRVKSVPDGAATAEEELGVPAIIALPAAGCLWTPFAQRASNAAGFRLFVVLPGMAFGNLLRHQASLKKREAKNRK